MISFSVIIFKIYFISHGNWLFNVAQNQHSYNLEIANLRGNIYDYRCKLLTGRTSFNIAAVKPCISSMNALSTILSKKEMEEIFAISKDNKPFKLNLIDKDINSAGIDVFKIPNRYSEYQLCPHIIGYIDCEGQGVCGIERAFNEYLSNTGSSISVKYRVDALNKVIDDNKRIIDDKSYLKTKGVVLTIDSRLQKIVQDVSKKYLDKGAVIITEVPNCKIRALASFPDFSPNNIGDVLNDSKSPLLNRAFLSYNIGSIFKLVTSSAALELGYPYKLQYNCEGYSNVENLRFNCFNGNKHGYIDMKNAIAYSCNSYFVDISRNLSPKKLLEVCDDFGFGKSIELAPSLCSESGNLPKEEELKNPNVMANISFGQGSLMCTPIQISALINVIASKGQYTEPSLVEGFIDENLVIEPYNHNIETKQVISKKTADILKEGMIASAEYGTSKKGKPDNISCAAKTATAETGIKSKDNKEVIQAWYAGFFPLDNPKYSVVILAEDAIGGGESCGPTFRDIVSSIYLNFMD